MGDITKNFSFSEFRPKSQPKSWIPSSEYQKILVVNLVENLQVIRDHVPKGVYMKVTSGVRLLSDYGRLIEAGYNPSKTSDHNCGVSIPLDRGTKKFKKFGETYNFAVGASDVISPGMKIWDLFKLSYRLTKEKMCYFGQIIYERNPKNGSEWVHYGNNLEPFFSKEITQMINKQKFLKSLDGGKTYSIVNSI